MTTDSSDPTTEAQRDSNDPGETSDAAVADALGFSVAAVGPEAADERLEVAVEELADRGDVPDLLGPVLSTLVEEIGRLRERVDDLEGDLEKTHDVATAAVGTAQGNESRIDDLEDQTEKTREISKCAIAKAQQVDSEVREDDVQEDAEALPGGVEPSTSPLDFFANCRQRKVKEIFVEQSNRSNTYRAIAIAKRWQEFATRRNDGSSIFWSRDDVESALTAHLGEAPHRQTVTRVRNKLHELGGSDVEKRRHQVGRRQDPKQVVEMDIETAHRLQENRYLGLDLLDGTDRKATSGGVTPVVTEGTAQAT